MEEKWFIRKEKYGLIVGPFWLRILFEPRDLWVGIYIKEPWHEGHLGIRKAVYICLVPMLPIYIEWGSKRIKRRREK